MTARLAIHEEVAASTTDVLARLDEAGVDVEVISEATPPACPDGDPLACLREEQVDLAVIGMGALRGAATEGLTMLAVLPRQEPRDVLVAVGSEPAPLTGLRRGARVAAAGARRAGFLRAHRSDLEVVELDGGADLETLRGEGVEAAIVWAGEARRAGWSARISELLDARSWPPDPGRGAVALIGRHPIAEVTALDHLPTRTALRAELALVDALDLPADAALGSLAQPSGRIMRLWAGLASVDGLRVVRADLTGPLDEPEQLGVSVARALVRRGAEFVIAGAGG